MFRNMYQGRRVFVTGHTGFKGSWICAWLTSLGAEVMGYSCDSLLISRLCTLVSISVRYRVTSGTVMH